MSSVTSPAEESPIPSSGNHPGPTAPTLFPWTMCSSSVLCQCAPLVGTLHQGKGAGCCSSSAALLFKCWQGPALQWHCRAWLGSSPECPAWEGHRWHARGLSLALADHGPAGVGLLLLLQLTIAVFKSLLAMQARAVEHKKTRQNSASMSYP